MLKKRNEKVKGKNRTGVLRRGVMGTKKKDRRGEQVKRMNAGEQSGTCRMLSRNIEGWVTRTECRCLMWEQGTGIK